MRIKFKAPLLLALFTMGLVSIFAVIQPVAQASAATKTEFLSKHPVAYQSVEVSERVEAPVAARDDFSVTVVTVVQWPSSDHTVSDIGDFGPRFCGGCSYFHEGDDFNPGGGTPVSVVADGVVIQSGWNGGLGESVTVRHNINGVTTDTVYGHMQFNSLRVSQGQHIKRGTTLGLVGSTGASTGNHLHFEVHVGGSKINPMPWLLSHVNNDEWSWLE